MVERSGGRWIVVGSLSVVALAGAFFVGRMTAPDARPVAWPDCWITDRVGIGVPEEFTNAEGIGFFNECESRAASGANLGEPSSPVKIYSSPNGTDVVAWWYRDCGVAEGMVPVGAPHPSKCSDVETTEAPP